MNNFMLDIRALGKAPDSPIFAIECVFFEPSTGQIGPQFYRAINIRTVGGIYPEAVLQLMKEITRSALKLSVQLAARLTPYGPPAGLLIPPHQNTKNSIAGLRAIQLMWLRWLMLSTVMASQSRLYLLSKFAISQR